MAEDKITLGQAIDRVIQALEALEPGMRETALTAVCAHLDIPLGALPTVTEPPPPKAHTGTRPAPIGRQPIAPQKQAAVDIRTLKEQKQPKSARQMACVVAYYLQELAPGKERKDTVSNQDLEKYFKQAKFALPKKLEQVLIDAKGSGYFESASRGEYRLNAVGYNLVAHGLPGEKES